MRYLLMVVFAVTLIVVALTGCATSRFGDQSGAGAVYRYTKTSPDGYSCSVEITSGREVAAGSIAIDDCDLAADADDLDAITLPREMLEILMAK